MYRSFTDRIFGGVCGGLAAIIPLNVWWFRFAFALLTLITTGAFAALYLLFWSIIPQKIAGGSAIGWFRPLAARCRLDDYSDTAGLDRIHHG